MHELLHAKRWKDSVAKAEGNLTAAWNEHSLLSDAWDPVAYLRNEFAVEAEVRTLLIQKYGGPDRIPDEVLSLMRSKRGMDQRALEKALEQANK